MFGPFPSNSFKRYIESLYNLCITFGCNLIFFSSPVGGTNSDCPFCPANTLATRAKDMASNTEVCLFLSNIETIQERVPLAAGLFVNNRIFTKSHANGIITELLAA